MSDNRDNVQTVTKILKPEHQALPCEMYAKWYHISCQGMGMTAYVFF